MTRRRFTKHQARFVAALEAGPAKLVSRTYRTKDGTRLRARTVELSLEPDRLKTIHYHTSSWAVPASSKLTGFDVFKSEGGLQ